MDTDESFSDAIVLLGRQFNNVLKRMGMKQRPNVKNMSFDISKNNGSQRKGRTDEKPNQGKGIQCHECEGFGHIKSECPTFLKNKKGMSVSWLDDDSEGELMMKQPNISQLLLVGVNLMKIPMMMYPMKNLPIHTKSYMPKVRSVGTKCV